eukprot:s1396_g3.t1
MPLSPEEHVVLQSLLEKAKSSSAVGSGEISNDGDFSVISEVIPPGAMTDGSKRRDDSSPVEVTVKKIGLSTGTAIPYPSSSSPPGMSSLGSESMLVGACPLSASEYKELTYALPAKVPDMATWGRTLITWGKYKSQNMSYADLVHAKDERALTYKNWCRQRVKTAEGHLLDFTRYLLVCDRLCSGPDLEQGPFIPGTSEARRYK